MRKNKGSHGLDGLSIERFAMKQKQYLPELQQALIEGSYQPLPVKRVFIPKAGGGERPLGIPAVKDRIVQTALKMVIEPIFEQERQHFSRKLKWGPSDFSSEKFAGGYCLRRPAFVLLRLRRTTPFGTLHATSLRK